MITVWRQGGFIQIHNRDRLPENVSKTKYGIKQMENCKKSAQKMLPKKRKNAQILLKSQESTQECWKCKTVLHIRKSAKRNRDMPI